MIRVRLPDPTDRGTLAKFMTFSNLVVEDDGIDAILIDFSRFDLDVSAQLRIVNKLIGAWQKSRDESIELEIDALSC